MFATPNPFVQYAKAVFYVAVLAALGFGVYKVWTFADSKIEEGKKIGKLESRVKELEQDNSVLKEVKETADAAAEKAAAVQEKYGETQEQYRNLSSRLAQQQRVFNNTAKTAKSSVDKASLESCRRFATETVNNLGGCRGHVERFGQEAVRSSAAAHAAVEAAGELVVAIPEIEIPEIEEPEVPEFK